MEWYEDRAIQQEDSKTPTGSNVLTTTSGNAQHFSANSKHHVDGQKPSSFSTSGSSWSANHRYPIPGATLRSNDRRTIARRNLYAQGLKKRFRLAQAYLQHPKFLKYKQRPRKELVKGTSEILWDEETETAFQNAIINIPAMGKCKKSQHGKPLGRNELITEWIRHETGRVRERKQISSHIQTLGKLFEMKPTENFAGIPEWQKMVSASKQRTTEDDGPDFYDNSIEHMVHHWKSFLGDGSPARADEVGCTPPSLDQSDVFGANGVEAVRLMRLEFDMWVSLPGKMDEALHRYTCIRGNETCASQVSLSSLPDWQRRWPDLVPVVNNAPVDGAFGVVLLKASFELMLDFPPPRSKLGISLELDFDPSQSEELRATEATTWNCITHIYQQGRLEAELKHWRCHSPYLGSVKPPFESRWWAEQFTRLTEERRQALDAGDDAAVDAADASARSYLQDITIMQQIFIDVGSPLGPDDIGESDSHHEKRLVVLLWTFSQAPPGIAGSTEWRRLIPPSHNPTPFLQEEALVPLPMNTDIEKTYNGPLHVTAALSQQPLGLIAHPYVPATEMINQDSFDVPLSDRLPAASMPYDGLIPYKNFSASSHDHAMIDLQNLGHAGDRVVQYHELYRRVSESNPVQNTFNPQEVFYAPSVDSPNREEPHPLQVFDRNTHRLLQARLQHPGSFEHPFFQRHINSAPPYQPESVHGTQSFHTVIDHDNYVVQRALGADAMTHAPVDTITPQSTDHTQSLHQPASHRRPSVPMVAPTAIRPPIQYHYSFEGVLRCLSRDVPGEPHCSVFSRTTDRAAGYVDQSFGSTDPATVCPSQGFVLELDPDQHQSSQQIIADAEMAVSASVEASDANQEQRNRSEIQMKGNDDIEGKDPWIVVKPEEEGKEVSIGSRN